MDNEKKLLELRQKADQLFSEKNWEELLLVSSEIIKLTPEDDGVYVYRGIAKINLSDYKGAINDYTKAIKIKPNNDDAYVNRGTANAKSNDFQDAINDYDKALKINPKNDNAYVGRSFVKEKLGDFQGEMDDCNTALKINPKNDRAYVNRSFAKEKLGDFQGEMDDCNTALKINPKNDCAYINRGVAKSKLGDPQDAINDYNKALEINPNSDRAYANRGVAKSKLGDPQSAINDYNKTLEINPSSDHAYANRGVAKSKLGDFQGAIDDFDEALEINPNNTQAIHHRGVAQAFIESQKQKEETFIEIKKGFDKQLKDTENELFQATHYKNEKKKYEIQFKSYSKKKLCAMFCLMVFVSIIVAMLSLYLYYLTSCGSNEWKILLFFPSLAIASLSLFPFIWHIRNIEHDRSRYWAMSEDMHTKWMFTLSIRHLGISEETREKLLLKFLEHLNNSNTPNIILSKDVGDKSDFSSVIKNFGHQKDSEQPRN